MVENPCKKTIFNEFVAFSDLQNNYQIKRLYALTSKCDCKVQGSTDRHLLVRADQLFGPWIPGKGNVNWLSERSEQIMVYALCGFSNFQCIGERIVW